MRKIVLVFGILALVSSWSLAVAGVTIFEGGVVVTPSGPKHAAIVVEDGRIAALVPPGKLGRWRQAGSRTVALDGAWVLPGLIDAHLHVTGYGTALETVDLRGARSFAEVVERVRRAARGRPGADWIQGRGWDQNLWPERKLPDRAALDRAFPSRPVFLRRIDGHAAIANAAALERAGIDGRTPDPPGGRIVRRPDGSPSGVLVDAAVDLVARAIPEPTDRDIERRILLAARRLRAFGLTQVCDAGTTARELRAMRRLAAAGRLPIRIAVLLDGSDDALLGRELAKGPDRRPGAMVRICGVKLYADGALGSRGALLGADYADDPGNRGLAVTPVDRLRRVIRLASRAGVQVAVHAIGDEAVHRVLELYAEVGPVRCRRLRFRVEHAQTVRPEDVALFARVGAIASVQPTQCTSDMAWAPRRLGPKRISWAYRWRSLLAAGVRLAGGSDAPVEVPDPFRGMFAAVTRRRPDGTPPGGWNPAERLTRAEAFELYTSWAAYALGAEGWSGTIETGKVAAFTIVDRDPFGGDPTTTLLRVNVLETVVGGSVRRGPAGKIAREDR